MVKLSARLGGPGGRSLVRRVAGVVAVALCGLAAVALWLVLAGQLNGTSGRVLLSAFAAAVCATTGLLGATLLECADARRWVGRATILLSAIVLALALVVVLATHAEYEGLNRTLGVSSALLAASVHASLMLGWLRPDDGRAVRWLAAAAVGFAIGAAVLTAAAFVFYHGSGAGGFWRVLGVIAVLGTLSTLLAPIARRLADPSGRPGTPGRCSTSCASRTSS